jgi:hypothetical protein
MDTLLWWTGLLTWVALIGGMLFLLYLLIEHAVRVADFVVRIWRRRQWKDPWPTQVATAARYFIHLYWDTPTSLSFRNGGGEIYFSRKRQAEYDAELAEQ